MPLKAAIPAATVPVVITTLGPLGTQSNISIAKTSKQLIEWYRDIITQLTEN